MAKDADTNNSSIPKLDSQEKLFAKHANFKKILDVSKETINFKFANIKIGAETNAYFGLDERK